MTHQTPEGTTHILRNRNGVEFYKEVSTDSYGNPTYVRWIKSRNNWAKVDQAFDHVKKYAEKLSRSNYDPRQIDYPENSDIDTRYQ